jgi:hypothetical protein
VFQPIEINEFQERTGNDCQGLLASADGIGQVIALRDITRVESLLVMPRPYLERMLANVTLVGFPDIRPYENCQIECARLDPGSLRIGQTFVQRSKYMDLMERFGGMFEGFAGTRGIAKRTAMVVIGRDQADRRCLAHYLPPIVEANCQQDRLFLMDGIHRNYMMLSVGTTIESIVIRGVRQPLPCDARGWDSVRPVDEKPPKPERFFNLRPEYFRDVKRIGIDG